MTAAEYVAPQSIAKQTTGQQSMGGRSAPRPGRQSRLGNLGANQGAVALACLALGCSAEVNGLEEVGEVGAVQSASIAQAVKSADFAVSFDDCSEFVGIGLVPAENAIPLVPADFELSMVGDSAIIVVRVAGCENISVDGKPAKPGTVAHIGLSLNGPDGSAQINNYTLWFSTDLGVLAAKLGKAGVDAELDQTVYTFAPDETGFGALSIVSAPPQGPSFNVAGTAEVPPTNPTQFIANWWATSSKGTTSMRTVFPNISFGGASTVLTAAAGSPLADLIGGTTLTFPFLDSYNVASSAQMSVVVD